MPGHIAITIGSTTTELLVDPNSYSEVDIVDFAPRAVTGTQAFSEMGLYLDAAQSEFGHGFGQMEYSEAQSYAYSGQMIDTRHDEITLNTMYTGVETSGVSNLYIYQMLEHNSRIVATNNLGIGFVRPSTGGFVNWTAAGGTDKMLDNGKYIFVTRYTSRMMLMIVDTVKSRTNLKIDFTNTTNFESTDMWVGGGVYIFDGTGFGTTGTVASSDSTSVTVASWSGTAPEAGSSVCVVVNTGLDANPPNNFYQVETFGGYFWASEYNTNYIHFWAEVDGSDAEGGGEADAAAVQVGPPGRNVTNLYPHNNQLWVFRPDGAWTVGEDNLAYFTLDFSEQISTLNFNMVTVWNGFLVFNIRNRIYKYRSGLQDITPPSWSEGPPFKQFGGWKSAVVRGDFLYVLGQSNAANSEEALEGTTGFTVLLATNGVGWHKLYTLPGTANTYFYLTVASTSNYLYYTYVASDNKGYIYKIQLQALSDLPYDYYDTSANKYWYSSYYDFGLRRISKSFASLTIAGRYPTNTSIVAAYRIDTTEAWTTLGTFTSDMQEIDFPTTVTGKRIQIRLTLVTTSSSVSPGVRALILKIMMRPDVLYGVTTDVIVSNDLSDQNRLMLGRTAAEIRAALQAARASVSPITFRDIYGNSASAYLASLRFIVVAYEDSDAVETIARCTFVYV